MSGRTVKVRIAVAVAPSGSWNSRGYGVAGRELTAEKIADIMNYASEIWDGDEIATGEARYWVEVDLPIPQETTVVASKVEAE